jgi:hypothetical protein
MAIPFYRLRRNNKPIAATGKFKNLGYENNSNPLFPVSATISGILKNSWNEVGDGIHSTFNGIGPDGLELKLITDSEQEPLMTRFEIPLSFGDYDASDPDAVLGAILTSEFLYEQATEERDDLNIEIPRFEKYSRPVHTYDEEYFSHIFNWPTTHTLRERKVGGFLLETNSCFGSTVYTPTADFNGSFTLDKVKSEIYYIDDNWNYIPITLDSSGRIANSSVSDRIGQPVMYHGGTDDNKLFFHYVLEGEGTPESVGTTNVVAIGDTINGSTVTNVLNYIVDVALKRTVSKHSSKNTQPAFLKLNTADGIAIGDIVIGKGIRSGTTVTGVNESTGTVTLSLPVNENKLKLVKFVNKSTNRVNKNTLCYAQISGGSGFSADQNYTVIRNGQSTGIVIKARAGKGIINRSAIVGTYFSKDKKQIEYSPLFYSVDDTCEKSYLEDDIAKYILGTITFSNSQKIEGKWLCINPKTEIGYKINSIYLSFINAPADKEELERWIAEYNQHNNIIRTYGDINVYLQQKFGGIKAVEVSDDLCRDEIQVEFTQVYDPFVEANTVTESFTAIEQSLSDCIPKTQEEVTELDDATAMIEQIISKSVSSSIVLTEEYYKQLVSNKDSLMNRIRNSSKALTSSVPKKTKIENLPAEIEGQDSSGIIITTNSYRDLPPSLDRVKFYINDVNIGSEKDLNPSLDLDPATTVNQPKIIIRSKPCWVWNGNFNNTFSFTYGTLSQFSAQINVNVNTDSEGYVSTITTSAGPISPSTASSTTLTGETPTICQISRTWVSPSPKNSANNITFGEKSVSYENGGYITKTSCGINPNLRDLDNEDRKNNDDINSPNAFIYPKTIWAPNINYQYDFQKTFPFRMEEVAELISETIENSGNPYQDNPLRAKLTRTLNSGDTTIHVQSTSGFLSSGYLIIPKYTKKIAITETGNKNSEFTYSGEEIIYYSGKTNTRFIGCTRECFGTSSSFELTIPVQVVEPGVRYKISSLGTTNWTELGAPNNATVGTIFVATSSGSGTGTVTVYGSIEGDIPDEELVFGVQPEPKVGVTTSYERGFSLSQYWPYTIKED